MRVLFTFPGKLGDALHQWPVALQWSEENDCKIEVGLGRTANALYELMKRQPCVSAVHRLNGIENEDMGGQPWDFGWGSDRREWDEVYHLGFRKFPERGLTRETYDLVPLKASFDEIANKASIFPEWNGPRNGRLFCVLHGTKSRPRYYGAMIRALTILQKRFEDLIWAGRADEWPYPAGFEGDGLPIETVAELIAQSALVFAASSGIAALAGAQKAPCIRVGEQFTTPNEIWDNPGPRQWSIPYETDPVPVLVKILAEEPWKR